MSETIKTLSCGAVKVTYSVGGHLYYVNMETYKKYLEELDKLEVDEDKLIWYNNAKVDKTTSVV